MSDLEQKRVLVVDDDSDTRSILRAVLASELLHVDEASNPLEAAERLGENRYSVILLDLVMPNGGGGKVLEILSELEHQRGAVVLVVTGARDSVVDALDPTLIHGIIRKPFDPYDVAQLTRVCTEVRGTRGLEAMCMATVLVGSPLIAWLAKL